MSRRRVSSWRWALACALMPILGALAGGGCGDDPQPTSSNAASSSSAGTSAGGSGGSGGGSGGSGATGGGGSGGGSGGGAFATYHNPLSIDIAAGGKVQNCPDPSIIRGQTPGHERWYLYCTSDPLNGADKDASGKFNEQLLPILSSDDLLTWKYEGNAASALPSWAAPNAELWAPDIQYIDGKYHLYYVVTETVAGGSAIGVALADSPTGPWMHEDNPVVEPHPAPCCSGSRRWVYDPSVVTDAEGKRYMYYGSYYGGLSVRALSEDGLYADPLTQVEVAVPNRYEAAYVIERDGFYYLFASASNCCNGELSGYSVFVGRAKTPLGPFVDREGVSLMAASVGGTPVLAQNGNRWVGTGHNAVFTDFAGQDWVVYHAVDRDDPYLEDAGDRPLKRQPLLDPLDWIDGWPRVRGGAGASDMDMPAPAAKMGDASHYQPKPQEDDIPAAKMEAYSDELEGAALDAAWSWVRPPAAGSFALSGGMLRFDTQFADLFEDSDNASVLLREAPAGEWLVETKVTLDVPPEGCCFNFAQAGLVIYKDDDNFIKLASYSNWDTRQIEFAKEAGPVPAGHPRYGAAVVGAHAKTLWLRIVKRNAEGGGERYTAYTSLDGQTWVRGATWTHDLGPGARIGLVAMAAPSANSPFPAFFEYVHVHGLQN